MASFLEISVIHTPCDRLETAGAALSYRRLKVMRSNLQIYTVHELDFRCRQTEEHASVQIIHSFYKLCSPYFRDDLRRGRKANSYE